MLASEHEMWRSRVVIALAFAPQASRFCDRFVQSNRSRRLAIVIRDIRPKNNPAVNRTNAIDATCGGISKSSYDEVNVGC